MAISLTAHRSLPRLGLHVPVVAVAGEVHHAHPVDGPRVPALLLGLSLLVAAEEGVHPLRSRGLAARPAGASAPLVTLLGDVAVIRVVIPLLLVGVGLVPLSLMVIIVSLKTKIQSGRLTRLLSLIVRAAWLAWTQNEVSWDTELTESETPTWVTV